ncbi:hypothetical protein MXB_1820 [Myxobolus squamalis]|nr:hypothetical protein MXB_1820 [Myxobolus squamalis]
MNLKSKIHKNLLAVERQEMLTKYNKLIKPTQKKALGALRISQSMICRLLRECKNFTLLPAQINTGRKRRRMGKDMEVKIALKL